MSRTVTNQAGMLAVGGRNRRGRKVWLLLGGLVAMVLLVAAILLFTRYAPNRPVTYARIDDHFKYGSIGSDIDNGLPVKILLALPRMLPEHLPPGAAQDLTAFGFIQEEGKPLPIGFSTRRRFVDLTGFNCAVCHVGAVRETPQSAPTIYLGMPSNTVDLQAFFDFLIAGVKDARFTPDNVLAQIEKDGPVDPIERLILRAAVPRMRDGLLTREPQLLAFMLPEHPRFGPGRVDTFNPYKTNQFAEYYQDEMPVEERIGTADFPSIWNQAAREGLNLHWDGNNSSVRERNFSAAFGAGATREYVDSDAIDRVRIWANTLAPPPYPFARTTDTQILQRGQQVFEQRCASCHAVGGPGVGQVVPLSDIGTDEYRLNSYTEKLAQLQLEYGNGYDWDFKGFTKTNGYSSPPLDGIWARAPYLHNGSVPTMWDLLTPAEQRNNGQTTFFTGHGVYDQENLGFRTDVEEVGGRQSFLYDLTQPGNSNKGHTGERYGTELSDEDKRALIEYLKGQ